MLVQEAQVVPGVTVAASKRERVGQLVSRLSEQRLAFEIGVGELQVIEKLRRQDIAGRSRTEPGASGKGILLLRKIEAADDYTEPVIEELDRKSVV